MRKSVFYLLALLILTPVSPITAQPTCDPDAPLFRLSIVGNGSFTGGVALSNNAEYIAFADVAYPYDPDEGILKRSQIFVYERQTCAVTLVTVGLNGEESEGNSDMPKITPDGRFITFRSSSYNLVADDLNDKQDIFVHDRQTGLTSRVSVTTDGTESNGRSDGASISADGRYVAFESEASNLVAGDTNGTSDAFVHDRILGVTTRISVSQTGEQSADGGYLPMISANGQYVAFTARSRSFASGSPYNKNDIFARDQSTGEITLVSRAPDGSFLDAYSSWPSISADGRFILFNSTAANLVPDDTNNMDDVFVLDRQLDTIKRVSMGTNGTQRSEDSSSADDGISANGQIVVFRGDNLISRYDAFAHNVTTGQTIFVPNLAGNASCCAVISPDGHYAAFNSYSPSASWYELNQTYVAQIDFPPLLPITQAPTLIEPAAEVVLLGTSHTFGWTAVDNAIDYQLQIDNQADFSSPEHNSSLGGVSRPVNNLAEGVWYWRVRGSSAEDEGIWSEVRSFTVIHAANLDAPQLNLHLTNTPTLMWSPVSWAVGYELEVALDADFTEAGMVYQNSNLAPDQHALQLNLPAGRNVYYWHVRAQAAGGKAGMWSITESFVVIS